MCVKEKKKLSFNQIIKYIIGVLFIIVAIIVFLFVKEKIVKKDSIPEIISKSTLEKVINVSDLSTFEAIYNGVASVANEEKPENIDYYVSYEAKVKAGIDFEKVNLEVNEDEKRITVTLPEVKITDVNVDIASLDYIFMNKRANTETVSAQAYKKCIEDVTNESNSTTAIYELAKQNARNIVEALIKPFVEQLDSKYELKIN
jgi:hypothetical protein